MPPASTPCASPASRCPALVVAAAAAALVGFLSGLVILRTTGLTLLMLTLAVTSLLAEAANHADFLTGGADGLQGVAINPILGMFSFDLFGRTAYLYCLVVLFLGWLLRAPPGALAVRPVADRHPRERRRACTRSARRCGGACSPPTRSRPRWRASPAGCWHRPRSSSA